MVRHTIQFFVQRNYPRGQQPSFARALVSGVTGLVVSLGLALIGVMLWQGITNTQEAEKQTVKEALNRGFDHLQTMIHAAELLADSVERVARESHVTGSSLRQPLEHALSAFEQRPELSFLGIALPSTGEYGNLERTASGEIRLWLFPGTRVFDPTRRQFVLTQKGFELREERPTDGYDPRKRPFYQAALAGPIEGTWMPTYQWIVHTGESEPLWGFSFVKAIRDAKGRPISVLDTDLDMPALNRFLASINMANRAQLSVVELGVTPRLIAGPGVDQAPLPLPVEFAALVKSSDNEFLGQMEIQGERRWVAAKRLALQGHGSWLVIASRTTPLIEATLRRQLLQVLSIGLAIALGLILISWRMTRRLGQPLAELEKRVANIGNNPPAKTEKTTSTAAGGFRETQLLSDAINRMTTVLQEQEMVKRQQMASLALKGAIFDSSTAAIFSLDERWKIIEWNGAAERLFGMARKQVLGRSIDEVVRTPHLPVDWVEIMGAMGVCVRQLTGIHGAFEAELRHVNTLQEAQDVHTIILTDVSERKRIEQQLRQERDYADAVLNSLPGVFYHYDQNMRLRRWNRNMERVTGYTAEELENATPEIFFADEDRSKVARQFQEVLAKGDSSVEADYLLRDGQRIPYLFTGVRFEYNGNHGFVGVGTDIRERKRAEERIRHLALYGDLTDLPNRRLLQERMEEAIWRARQTGRQLALLYLDLDHFKVVNDSYGHLFGDAVLRAVGERLQRLVNTPDTVAHLSGDEFLILLTDLQNPSEAQAMANRIIENFDRIIIVQEREIHLPVSIGVSTFPYAGETINALIDNANMAMYRAKELGHNTCHFFTHDMGQETQRRIDLEIKLRNAAPLGQLRLVYQPKVRLSDGRISGCEALLRWHHPDLGDVSPGLFIPIAEDSGLIVAIGDWVLRTACQQARAWMDAGLPSVCVAVNISARQFLQQDIVAWVMRTLEETGLPPTWLELELTESLIAQDIEKVTETINQFKKLGVKLSIDDFGTGYSSLNYLRRFHVDTLKIDQSFVQNMLNEKGDETIVLAVISLAHNLKFKVIAEGVETAEHYQFLRLNGCDEIQGYYFSKPVTANEFEDMLLNTKQIP